jgi:hypothetical protein
MTCTASVPHTFRPSAWVPMTTSCVVVVAESRPAFAAASSLIGAEVPPVAERRALITERRRLIAAA